MPKDVWDDRLICRVSRLEYDFVTRVGKLYFPLNDCCDMQGAVGLFCGIDMHAKRIETFADNRLDTVYNKDGVRWSASHGGSEQTTVSETQ